MIKRIWTWLFGKKVTHTESGCCEVTSGYIHCDTSHLSIPHWVVNPGPRVLGRPAPITGGWVSFGGSDIIILIDGVEYGAIQAISMQYDGKLKITSGSIVGLVFHDGGITVADLFKKPFNITAVASNEYGGSVTLTLDGALLTHWVTGSSVDDILLDESLTYESRQMPSFWKKREFKGPDA